MRRSKEGLFARRAAIIQTTFPQEQQIQTISRLRAHGDMLLISLARHFEACMYPGQREAAVTVRVVLCPLEMSDMLKVRETPGDPLHHPYTR